jgi:hypothetical protein
MHHNHSPLKVRITISKKRFVFSPKEKYNEMVIFQQIFIYKNRGYILLWSTNYNLFLSKISPSLLCVKWIVVRESIANGFIIWSYMD